MTQVTQANKTPNGNTKGIIRARIWSITINNPTVLDITQWKREVCLAKKCIWQLEEGESKTTHLQGHIEYANARTLPSLKNKLPRAHIEKTNSVKHSEQYCMKDEGRLDGPFIKGFPKPIKIIETLRPWQQEIIDLIETEPDDRTIHWYVDKTGGIGKTQLCKYIVRNYNALYLTGRATDMKYLISKYIEENEENADNLICLFDYTRSIENYVSYQGMEEIKNGIFTNTKYEVKTVIMNSPHIIVMSNFDPEESKFSENRWVITQL